MPKKIEFSDIITILPISIDDFNSIEIWYDKLLSFIETSLNNEAVILIGPDNKKINIKLLNDIISLSISIILNIKNKFDEDIISKLLLKAEKETKTFEAENKLKYYIKLFKSFEECDDIVKNMFIKILVFKIIQARAELPCIKIEGNDQPFCPSSLIKKGEVGLCLPDNEQMFTLLQTNEFKIWIVSQLYDLYNSYFTFKNNKNNVNTEDSSNLFIYGILSQIAETIAFGYISINNKRFIIKKIGNDYIGYYDRQGKEDINSSYYNLNTGEDMIQSKTETEKKAYIDMFNEINETYSLNCNNTDKPRFILTSTSKSGGYSKKNKKSNKLNKIKKLQKSKKSKN